MGFSAFILGANGHAENTRKTLDVPTCSKIDVWRPTAHDLGAGNG